MFRSLVLQGNPLPVNNWPTRLVFITWYLFCYNIYAFYAGILTAVLTVPVFEKPVDSLADLPLAAGEGFAIGTLKDSSTETLFRQAESGIYYQVWQLFHPVDSLLPDPELGFDKVLGEKFVLINSQLNAEIRATVKSRDKYHFSRETFYPHGYSIACTTGAPFRPNFERMLSGIIEAGLINHWAEGEIQKLSGKVDTDGDETEDGGPSSLTVQHLQAAFFLLALGGATSSAAFLVEVLLALRQSAELPDFFPAAQ
ncbi:uncharacterized protein LOC121868195 [Homarus americanus]|uniref:uncharacterized protein LOC121868195 n=1 Tax=Homarus americanus TaxID=6706 RepID=UPI001C43DD73|nr:uncharacterized protein LOC121868195 [Homarus americanus]XP_042224438.1 uncharacterized protein LOC121868195 [Homarus americanus]